jgi:hypothetical protein
MVDAVVTAIDQLSKWVFVGLLQPLSLENYATLLTLPLPEALEIAIA